MEEGERRLPNAKISYQLEIGCKGTTFFGHVQIIAAKSASGW